MDDMADKGRGVRLPRRSARYGVGKQMGPNIYLHRAYERLLGPVVETARRHLPPGFVYTVVKYNQQTGAVSFIHSPDFDTAPEPTVGDLWTVSPTGAARLRRQLPDPYLYHHKWLFVADNYPGFDVQASKARSLLWHALPDVDRSRIGRRSYWEERVLPRLPGDAPRSTP
jgi:hypothetical protein